MKTKIMLLAIGTALLFTACGQVQSNPIEATLPPTPAAQEEAQQPQATPEPTTTAHEPDTVPITEQEPPQKENTHQEESTPQTADTPEPIKEPPEDIPSEIVHAKTGYIEPEPTPEPEPTLTPSAPADRQAAIDAANAIASEHLEIITKNPFDTMTRIRNAGAIFLGEYASEPLGDYFAGPNHILPTNGTARFFSPVNVDDFIKKTSIISYSRQALEKVHNQIETFAKSEGLTAHANSIKVRFED